MKGRKYFFVLLSLGLLCVEQPSSVPSNTNDLITKNAQTKQVIDNSGIESYSYLPVAAKNLTLSRSSITSKDLLPTEITNISSFNGLKSNKLYEYDFSQGAMGHTLKFTIDSMQAVNGYYSNSLGHFYTKSVLESTAVKVVRELEYTCTKNNCVSLSSTALSSVAFGLSIKAGVGNAEGAAEAKAGSSFYYSNVYTWDETKRSYYDEYYKLDQTSAEYCPDGYSMSLGLFGQYTVMQITATEYTNWWWGQYVTQGTSENTKITAVISNEGNMTVGFVYKKSNNYYYQEN